MVTTDEKIVEKWEENAKKKQKRKWLPMCVEWSHKILLRWFSSLLSLFVCGFNYSNEQGRFDVWFEVKFCWVFFVRRLKSSFVRECKKMCTGNFDFKIVVKGHKLEPARRCGAVVRSFFWFCWTLFLFVFCVFLPELSRKCIFRLSPLLNIF